MKSKKKNWKDLKDIKYGNPRLVTEKVTPVCVEPAKRNDVEKLEYYGGAGYEYSKEDGDFKVVLSDNEVGWKYKKLSAARRMYDSIADKSKALWDVTTVPELLEAHVIRDKK